MSTRTRSKRKSQVPINRDLKNEYSGSDTENDQNSDNITEKTKRRGRSLTVATKHKTRQLSSTTTTTANEQSGSDTDIKSRRGRHATKNKTRQLSSSSSTTTTSGSELIESSDLDEIDKPSEVLTEQDVAGKSMFGFKTPKKRGGFAQRVSEIRNNPFVSTTPTNKTIEKPETPYTLRNKRRQNFAKLLQDTDEDFSASESDFKATDQSSSSSSSSASSEEKTDDEQNTIKTKIQQTSNKNKEQTYIMKSEDYFSWQSSSKIITSNHTLQKLKQPKLSEEELQELLTACNLNQSQIHQKLIHEMFKSNCSNFNKWIYMIHEGFNILLYGLGSKRNILHTFQKEMLGSSPVVVVNGYFPSLTIKDVTDSILDLFEDTSSGNVYEAVEMIKEHCRRSKNINLYLIVHNIDGPMLRNLKSQNVLSLLAEIANVHLLASIDHINTPLIWDHSKLSKFNFTWWDVTSFLPYTDETSFESSMLVQRSGALALSSLSNVYQSLTKNSKGIFILIVKYQLQNKSVKYYQGMPFKELYSQCRENFLVSSDLALRTQLTEFLDHKLMKSKRTVEGVEHLNIPINNSLLQQFLEQIS